LDFELRDAAVSDIDACIERLPSRFLADPAPHAGLRGMWAEIIRSKSGLAALAIEPGDRSDIIHFGFNVFVTDERADAYHRCETPLIARQMIQEWAAGRRPFLSAEEIARANARAGLNLVVIHYGGIQTGNKPDERMYAADYESSRRIFLGWNLRSYTAEIFTLSQQDNGGDWARTLGFRAGEYSDEQLQAAGIPSDEAPCVWMARREDAGTNPGFALALLFTSYRPPRLGFTPIEQHLLGLALDGHTDETIARVANVALPTVKKRLRTIYDKVRDAPPIGGQLTASLTNGMRGAETRRHLLNYIREHPEELRPYDARAAVPGKT
jgi:hypothetical protein